MRDDFEVFSYWPIVAEDDRPRAIYVMNIMPTAKQVTALEANGYIIIDVRGLSDRTEAVQKQLQGISEGTILSDPKAYKYVELEAKVLGLTAPKVHTPEDDTDIAKGDIDAILASIPGDGVEERSKPSKRRDSRPSGRDKPKS